MHTNPLRRGRPPLPSAEIRSARIVLILTPAQRDSLLVYARELKQTMSGCIIELLTRSGAL